MTRAQQIDRIMVLQKSLRISRIDSHKRAELDVWPALDIDRLLTRLEIENDRAIEFAAQCEAKQRAEDDSVPLTSQTLCTQHNAGGGRRVIRKADGMGG